MSDALPSESGCIFCRIVAGEIPCYSIYEGEQVLAFLDVGPLSHGHTLLIPRGHWRTLDQVPAEVSAEMGRLLPRLSQAVMQAAGAEAWNVLQNNGKAAHQAVDHVHMHLIPKFADSGLGITWPAGKLEDAAAEQLQREMTQALQG